MDFDASHYWAVLHDEHGWLVDTGVGGTYDHDFDKAGWYRSALEAIETLIACDLLKDGAPQLTMARWSRAGCFLIVQIS